jgi:TRAP-type C4-dicarboxylate transport system substrate-binding protein
MLTLRQLLFACLAVAPGMSSSQVVLKMQAPAATNPAAVSAASDLAADIERRTNGQVKVQVFPPGALVAPAEVEQALRQGMLDIGFVPLATLDRSSDNLKNFRIYQLPFAFEDLGVVGRFQASGAGQQMLASLSGTGLKSFAYLHDSMQVLASKKSIKSPDDLKGLKVAGLGTGNPGARAFELAGARPTALQFAELSAALSQGQVDSASVSSFTAATLNAASNYAVTNHTYRGFVIAANESRINSLPIQQARQIQGSIQATAEAANQKAVGAYWNSVSKLQSTGQVNFLSGQERSKFQATVKPTWDEFRAAGGGATLEAALAAGGGTGGGGDPCPLEQCRCENKSCSVQCCKK